MKSHTIARLLTRYKKRLESQLYGQKASVRTICYLQSEIKRCVQAIAVMERLDHNED